MPSGSLIISTCSSFTSSSLARGISSDGELLPSNSWITGVGSVRLNCISEDKFAQFRGFSKNESNFSEQRSRSKSTRTADAAVFPARVERAHPCAPTNRQVPFWCHAGPHCFCACRKRRFDCRVCEQKVINLSAPYGVSLFVRSAIRCIALALLLASNKRIGKIIIITHNVQIKALVIHQCHSTDIFMQYFLKV